MIEIIAATNLAVSVRLPGGNKLPILKKVNFSLSAGTSAAIVGRSGSGKSTLLALLGLLQKPDSGKLQIAGKDVSHINDNDATKLRNTYIGFIFQNYSLIEHLTVKENVELPFSFGYQKPYREINLAVEEALDRVNMTQFAKRMPAQLSGGEQQRVAIARALVRKPPLLLADEPTGALDIDTGSDVMSVLKEVSEGAGLVIVTHDIMIAESCTQLWHITDGKLFNAKSDKF